MYHKVKSLLAITIDVAIIERVIKSNRGKSNVEIAIRPKFVI